MEQENQKRRKRRGKRYAARRMRPAVLLSLIAAWITLVVPAIPVSASEDSSVLTYEDSSCRFTVQAAKEDAFPEDTTLEVREIPAGSGEYNTWKAFLDDELIREGNAPVSPEKDSDLLVFYELRFISQGGDVLPEVPVDVQAEYKGDALKTDAGRLCAVTFRMNAGEMTRAALAESSGGVPAVERSGGAVRALHLQNLALQDGHVHAVIGILACGIKEEPAPAETVENDGLKPGEKQKLETDAKREARAEAASDKDSTKTGSAEKTADTNASTRPKRETDDTSPKMADSRKDKTKYPGGAMLQEESRKDAKVQREEVPQADITTEAKILEPKIIGLLVAAPFQLLLIVRFFIVIGKMVKKRKAFQVGADRNKAPIEKIDDAEK